MKLEGMRDFIENFGRIKFDRSKKKDNRAMRFLFIAQNFVAWFWWNWTEWWIVKKTMTGLNLKDLRCMTIEL